MKSILNAIKLQYAKNIFVNIVYLYLFYAI